MSPRSPSRTGTRLSFEYDNPTPGGPNGANLRAVTSSNGYALLIEQAGANMIAKACVINLSVTAKPSNNVCPSGAVAASYTYVSYAGKMRLSTVTDPTARVSSISYGSASGAVTMGFVKPGESTAWLTNVLGGAYDEEGVSQEIVGQQLFADGQSYSYSFDYTPEVEGHSPTIAGGSYVDALYPNNPTIVRFDFPAMPGSMNPPRVSGQGYPYVNFGDINYQETSGPIEITDPLGRVTRSDYCDPGAMAGLPSWEHNRCYVTWLQSFTDPRGIKTVLTYDGWRNIAQVRRKAADSSLADLVTSATYNCGMALFKSCAKPVTTTDANGNVTTYTYSPDHGGILTKTGPAVSTRQPGGGFASVSPQTRYSYAQRYAWISNGSGGYVQAANPVWLLTQESFCRVGAPSSSGVGCALVNDEVLTAYDYGPDSGPNTLLLRGKAVSADGVTLRTCYGYDGNGRKVSETLPRAGLTACTGVPPAGAADFTTVSRLDAAGRVLGTIGPDPDDMIGPIYVLKYPATRNTYDAAGRLVKVETGELATWQGDSILPANWTGFTIYKTIDTVYDALDRKVKESVSGGGFTSNVTQYEYDLAGRLKCTAARMNPAVFGSLPSSACELGTPGTPGSANDYGPDRITRNTYDAAGQLLTVTEAYGTQDAAAVRTNSYTATGQIETLTDAENNRTTYEYDAQDRLMKTRFPVLTRGASASSTTDAEQYGYDPNGNRTSFTKRDGSLLNYTFDALNRMTVKVVPERQAPGPQQLSAAQTRDVYYAYDLRNLQTEARFDSLSGEGLLSEYDGFGRLTKSTTWMGGNSRYLRYQYDPDGNRTRLTFQDDNYVSSEYDGLDRPVWIRENGVERLGLIYYYPHGGRKIFHRLGTSTTYYYDTALRPSQIYIGYQPSAANRVDNWFLYNPANEIVSDTRNNDSYAWTAHFNVGRNYTANGLNQYTVAGDTGFAYDANANLIQSGDKTYVYNIENRLVGSPSGGITLTYDPMGRLFQVTGGTTGTTQFLYDGNNLVAEYDGSNVIKRRYAHGPGVDEPIAWYDGATFGTNRRRLQEDRHGSIVSVTDSAGNLIAINTYDEYGIPAATNLGRFQYTGQAWLDELGMYYYKARIYSPTLGRFMQTDPIGYEDQVNLYAYVRDDPVNGVDPSGKATVPRQDQSRVVIVYPQSSYEHLQRRHSPNGTAQDRYNWNMSKAQAEKLAGDTIIDAEKKGTWGYENGYYSVYESRQGGWFSSIGSEGQDVNRVATINLGAIGDKAVLKEVAQELARPEMVAAIAQAMKKSPGPVNIQVVVSQYPVKDENRKFKDPKSGDRN